MSELALLGGFALSLGGVPLPGLPAGSQRLLAYLALREDVVPRHEVTSALSPESTAEDAQVFLRSAVEGLAGPARQVVTVTSLDLGLADDVVVDLRRSQSVAYRLIDRDVPPIAADIDASAVSALSDDLLPGWYDDWAVLAAEVWRQLRARALEAVAARLTAADRWAEAATAALAAVRVEPLRESARAALIRVHIAAGNRAEARAEFQRYAALLHAELGVEPTARLGQLLDDLDSQ